ncbi:Receptor y region, transmembrane domain- and RING domain-containing protein 2 [Wickerhamiella sorbophila]|uniref:Receptor y region, transmembrane domain-and RING domain-containing protein 2 n=1 Tax=Wickerhamiella sorbophila TaxID=45607 RepID=A0A2T0FBT5_9ASCO|nr:Receptor y region, transmembrane domain- and RING domain-containing protein 2 [Wickerhamiella sorbophila]PRT52474.1 Receptor y region, transmembrane domain- and RING domain-containing protein 2 [Wickerhamiella sorbophila]
MHRCRVIPEPHSFKTLENKESLQTDMAGQGGMFKAKKVLKAVVHTCERSVALGVALVGMIFFVPVFVAEALIRIVKGRPPEESDTEEIMVPIRKMRIRTIDAGKIAEAFPEKRFDELANKPAKHSTPSPSPAGKADDHGHLDPPAKAAKPATTAEIEPDKTCSVCLADFDASDKVRQLSCQHIFHQHCIDEWFTKYHSYCPLCQLDYYDPANPRVLDQSEVSELVMTPLTVTRPRKREYWLETHLNRK